MMLQNTRIKILCDQILTAPMPQSLIDELTPMAETLLENATYGLVVRSSGANEDSATASFAGVYESYLDMKHVKHAEMSTKAVDLQHNAKSIKQQIEALLWARDTTFELYSISSGPPQSLFGTTITLLRNFISQHAPTFEADPLNQGHHPDLNPYYPHIQVLEAEKLAQTIDKEQRAFEQIE